MKFLKNKNAFTLIELTISLTIVSILFLLLFGFLSKNAEEITNGNYKIVLFDEVFKLRDKINKLIIGGYIDTSVISLYNNDVLYLKDAYEEEGAIFGIVNKDTMKLQQDYTYGNNVLGYRLISKTEISDINSDNSVIYNYTFFQDKVYNGLITKDFNIDLYNSGTILDINIGLLDYYNSSYDGLSFTGNVFLSEDLHEINFNF